jgi:hypothetical protein
MIHFDITLTIKNSTASEPIAVPKGDLVFDKFSTGDVELPFQPSLVTEDGKHLNAFTPHLDLSGLYGNDATRAAEMRLFTGIHNPNQ